MEMLSIIVPVYNVEKYLEQCLDSILAQTYNDFELILVNDGSTDSCGVICDKYKAQDSRVKVIHKKNAGLVSARKTGVQAAKGKYVAYVDSDDWIDQDMYAVMMQQILSEDADIVACAIKKETHEGSEVLKNNIPSGVYKDESLTKMLEKVLYTGEFYESGLFPAVWNKIYRKDILEQNQMRVNDKLRMGEDAMCTYPLLLDCSKVIVLNDFAPYHYRRMDVTMSNAYDANYFDRMIVLLQDLRKVFTEKDSKILLEQLQFYNLFIIGMGIRQEYSPKRSGFFRAVSRYKALEKEYNISDYISFEAVEKLPEMDRRILKACREKKYFLMIACMLLERVKVLVKR